MRRSSSASSGPVSTALAVDFRVTRGFVAMQHLLNRLRSVVGFPYWAAFALRAPAFALGAALRAHATGHGLACQILLAYSAIVRSLENFPDAATFRSALPAQAWGSAYRLISRASASREAARADRRM